MSRKIAIDDFMGIALISDPQVSPDGNRIACVKRIVNREKNKYRGEIWVMLEQGRVNADPASGARNEADEPAPRCWIGGEGSHGYPRWSPDGKTLAFLSDRQKPLSQIYGLPTEGGEARPLTKLEIEGSIAGFRWSPDGSKIAFLFRETPVAYRKEASEERQKKEIPPPPRVHTRLGYRLDGFGYWEDSYWQIWVLDLKTGEAKPLTAGDTNCDLPTWSPDSRTLTFLSDRRDDRDISPYNDDIWTVSSDGGDLLRISSPPGSKSALVWSPDGKSFAYAGNPDPNDAWGTNNERVCVLPVEGSDTAHDLTGHTDRAVGYLTLSDVHDSGAGDLIQWDAGSRKLWFAASVEGDTALYAADRENGNVERLSGEKREVGSFSIHTAQNSIVYAAGSATAPHELYVARLDGSDVLTRTTFNREWRDEVQLVEPEVLDIDNGEGGKVPAWLLRPPDVEPGEKIPLVLYVHGGPHAQYGNTLFHELQWLAAEGFAVLYCNPRGSKGYGEAHTKAIAGDWGNHDYTDLMRAVDAVCEREGIDAARTAIMGGSYGGYMTAWTVGHTDRFQCAIADRLVGNLHSMAGTCDFAWRPDSYYRGDAWNDPSDYWKHSPLAFAGQINTPLLLIHSDGDLRCPVSQAEELFAALRLQRKTVEFVRYPAQTSHGMSRNGPPDLRLDRLRRNRDWLVRWLKS